MLLWLLSGLHKMRLTTNGHLGKLWHARLTHNIRTSVHLSETLCRIKIECTLGPSLDMRLSCRRHVGSLAKTAQKSHWGQPVTAQQVYDDRRRKE
jgi:hypothetical protein